MRPSDPGDTAADVAACRGSTGAPAAISPVSGATENAAGDSGVKNAVNAVAWTSGLGRENAETLGEPTCAWTRMTPST